VDHLVLVAPQSELAGGSGTWILALTRARIALTVLKICCAGETSTAFLFRISILLSRSNSSALRVRAVIITDLVRGVAYKLDDGGRIEGVWAVRHKVSRLHRIRMRANVRTEAPHHVLLVAVCLGIQTAKRRRVECQTPCCRIRRVGAYGKRAGVIRR